MFCVMFEYVRSALSTCQTVHTYIIFLIRYSPNYVAPLTVVHSPEYGNNEILDYTRSPQHCVPTGRVVVDDTKLQDNPQSSQFETLVFNAQRSPDPWAKRKQAQNLSSREQVYVVTKQDSFKCADLSKADSKAPSCQVITNEADSTVCSNQSSTSTAASSIEISVRMGKLHWLLIKTQIRKKIYSAFSPLDLMMGTVFVQLFETRKFQG